MPTLKTVWVWGSPGDADEDLTAFESVSRAAFEIVSDGARRLGLTASRPELRIFLFREIADRPSVELVEDLSASPRVAHVAVPQGFASASIREQQQLVLARMSAVLHALAAASGWGDDVVPGLINRVGEAGFVFRWQSPVKTSPDRRHKAVVRGRLDETGVGQVSIAVLAQDGKVVSESSEVRVRPTVEEFTRAGKALSWTDASRVRCRQVPGLQAEVP